MTEYTNNPPATSQRSPFVEIILIAAFVFAGLMLGNFLGFVIALPFVGTDFNHLLGLLSDPAESPEGRNLLLLLQGVISIMAFIVAPLAYLNLIERRSAESLNPNKYLGLTAILLAAFLIIVFMPFNSLLVNWNQSINYPNILGFDDWARAREGEAQRLTQAITSFDSVGQFLVGLVVIALIPGIGEELLFRGLIQPKFHRLFGNIHVAVWVTGFLFSFIHFQFFGLIPRMMLGVLLGYLYAWSGNLWYPIVGHMANNGFTLLMVYLYRDRMVEFDITETQSFPVGAALISLGITIAVLLYLKKYFDKNKTPVYD